MIDMHIRVASHFYVATRLSPTGKNFVAKFCHQFKEYDWVTGPHGTHREAVRMFAASNEKRTEFRFHIYTLEKFKQALEEANIYGESVAWEYMPIPQAESVELTLHSHYEDLPHQPPVIEYLKQPPPPRSKLVVLQTGKGKGYCTMRGLEFFGKRVVAIIRPQYLIKWVDEFREKCDIDPIDIMVVQGGDSLRALLSMAKDEDFTPKVILISNRTHQQWVSSYESFGADTLDLGYDCLPDQLFEHLKAGIRLIDEVHQDFHYNYKLDLYTNIDQVISLSATMEFDSAFVTKMSQIAYPTDLRFKGQPFHKYVDAISVFYRFREPNRIRTRERNRTTYSQHALEKSIIKYSDVLKNFLFMLNRISHAYFFRDHKPREKLLIYCISIDMCTRVTEYLKQIHPDKDVRRFVENDPEENRTEPDVIVSSLQKAGTAFDIPNLRTVIMAIATTSSPGNIQGFGRLRELKNGSTPRFVYLSCTDIKKHLEYHERKKTLLNGMALTYRSDTYGNPL